MLFRSLLGAPQAHCTLPEHAFAEPELACDEHLRDGSRQAVPGTGDLWGGEERSFEVGARQRAS